MKLFQGFSLPKILLFIPFLLAVLCVFFIVKKNRTMARRAAINKQVNTPFPSLPLIDANGNAVTLNLSQHKLTVIDFWFKNCPGCVIEMSQFEEALKGKEKEIGIISVCVDDTTTFRNVLNGKVPPLDFVKTLSNWHHLLLNFPPEGGNNKQQLFKTLAVHSYPSYFVLNKDGIVQDIPQSAVDYIKTSLQKQNQFVVFLTSKGTWQSRQTWMVVLLSLFIYQLIANLIVKRSGDKD